MDYNSVLFKLDDGQLCVFLRQDGQWDFKTVVKLQDMEDKFPDLASDPFEFVFCHFDGEKKNLTCGMRKTTVQDMTFLTLHEAGLLQTVIEHDFRSLS
jgi:hypothetical protein